MSAADLGDEAMRPEQPQTPSDPAHSTFEFFFAAAAGKIGLANVSVAKPVEDKLPLVDQFQQTAIFPCPGVKRAIVTTGLGQGSAAFLNPLEKWNRSASRTQGFQVALVGSPGDICPSFHIR